MPCNPHEVGWVATYWCEYSKACVRCFPLMAMVVSLVVAARVMLTRRTFYASLRRGVLIDFENFDPLHDPLFWIVIWSLLSASLHFVLDAWTRSGLLIHEGRIDIATDVNAITKRGVVVYYFVPVAFFIAFLY